MTELVPISSFPVLFPEYVAQQQETILFKGRQYGSTYDVSVLDGRPLLAVESMPSLGRRLRVLDVDGKNIYWTRKETFHLGGSRYFIEKPARPKATNFLTMKFKILARGTKFTAYLNNALVEQQHQGQLCFSRGYFDTIGTITDGEKGPAIAYADRKIIELRKEYRVVVAKGVDIALIAGLIICLDDQEKSHKNAPALGGGRWG